ncbi:MAG TPA: putative Ig domain-containing protein, partial [Panacibacter sp.]|nr:putative Ig domain-containing protein [Panacibacter sp.]
MKTFLHKSAIFSIVFLMANLCLIDMVHGQVTQPVAWTKAYDVAAATGNTTSFAIPSGSNRILVVGVTASNTASSTYTLSTLTYGGQNLTAATSNLGSSGHAHTALYFLKDNAVMDNTSRPLVITLSAAPVNMTVWYAVFAGVDQTPATYTNGNGFTNTSGSGPAALSAAMSINANEQAIYISSIQNATNTTIPTYTINGSWASGGTNTGTNAPGGEAWKNEVATRTIPGTSTTDAATTSALAPTSNERYAMSAMSLPTAVSLTASSLTTFGNICTNITAGPNSFTITGTNLSAANITVGALSGYSYSTTAGGVYTTSLSLTHAAGAYSQQIFVKFTPTAVQSYNGNIQVGGGGASTINVAASGSGVTALSGLTYTVPTATYCIGTLISSNTVSAITGGGTITYSVSPVLPTGLSLNTSTGAITGTPTSASAATNYTITASNGSCSTTATVSITVSTAPSITAQPVAQTACSTPGTASFTVAAAGTGLTYQWRLNGVNLSDGANVAGSTTATLSLSNLTSANTVIATSGYDCIVTGAGSCSVTSTRVALTVNTVPSIGTQPTDQTACSTPGTASFTVAAAGTGLTYQWRLNGVNLVNGVQGNGSTVSGATTNTLSLSTLTTANTVAAAAGYDCIVSGTAP